MSQRKSNSSPEAWQKHCAHSRAYYKRNREKCLATGRRRYQRDKAKFLEANSLRRESLRTLVTEAKCKPCADCHRFYHPFCMDFDHVRGIKLKAVSLMVAQNYSKRLIVAEIAKCDVVCSNCHRLRTLDRKLRSSHPAQPMQRDDESEEEPE